MKRQELRSVQHKSIISFHETYVASSLFLNKPLCKQVRQQVFHFNICPFEDDKVECFQYALRGTGGKYYKFEIQMNDEQNTSGHAIICCMSSHRK